MQDFTGYTLALIAILSAPGPTNALLATSGATVGLARSLHLLAWGLLAYATAIAVERALLLPAIDRVPAATRLLDAAAALYLTGLAFVLWRPRLGAGARTVHAHQHVATTLLNPKALIIALVLMPLHPVGASSVGSQVAAAHLGWQQTVVGPPRNWAMLAVLVPVSGLLWICVGRYVRGRAAPRLSVLVPRAASLVLALFAALLVVAMLS